MFKPLIKEILHWSRKRLETQVDLRGFGFLTWKKGLTMPATPAVPQGRMENLQGSYTWHLLVFSQWWLSSTFRFSRVECVFHFWAPRVFSVSKGKNMAGVQPPCPSPSHTIHSFIHLFSERVLGTSSVHGTGNTDESRSGKHTATGMQSCNRGEPWTVERHCLMQSTGLWEDSWESHVWCGFWRMHVNYAREDEREEAESDVWNREILVP